MKDLADPADLVAWKPAARSATSRKTIGFWMLQIVKDPYGFLV